MVKGNTPSQEVDPEGVIIFSQRAVIVIEWNTYICRTWHGFSRCNDLGVGEFCHKIAKSDHDFPEAVVDNLRSNGISGSVFLQLSAEELKELAPHIADRVLRCMVYSCVRKLYVGFPKF